MYKCIKSQRPGFGLEQYNGIGRDSHPHNKSFPKAPLLSTVQVIWFLTTLWYRTWVIHLDPSDSRSAFKISWEIYKFLHLK